MKDLLEVDTQAIQQAAHEAGTQSEGYVDAAQAITIHNNSQYEFAGEALKEIKTQTKALEDQKKQAVDPIKKGIKAMEAWFKTPLTNLKSAEASVKVAMSTYLNNVEQQQQKLLGQAQVTNDRAFIVRADEIQPPKIDGVQTRRIMKYEIEDADKVPDEYWVIDQSALRKDLTKGVPVSGVRVWHDVSIAASAK